MIRMGEAEGANWGESANLGAAQRDWGVAGDPRRGERGDTGHLPPPSRGPEERRGPTGPTQSGTRPPGLSASQAGPRSDAPPEQPLVEAEAALGAPGPPRRVGAARGTAGLPQGRLLVRARGDDVTARATARRRDNGRGQSR